MRECINKENQKQYWDSISDMYAGITRISLDDFHYGPQIPGESTLKLLPKFTSGMTSLELGSGAAQNSIFLNKKFGMHCIAMDISEERIKNAQELCREESAEVELQVAGFENFLEALKQAGHEGEQFDFVHSSHAIEFVQDPATIVKQMTSVLKPGGVLMLSTVHPVYNGTWFANIVEDEEGNEYEEFGQFLTNYIEPPDDIRDEDGLHVVSRAHSISNWFDWLTAAGLTITAIKEPAAVEDAPYTSDDWADHEGQLDAIPSTLILVAKKSF
jgi:ubiquinone/menaquinone biosynthesis C-methylase UbiE